MIHYKKLGELLAERRKEKGYTQQTLSRAIEEDAQESFPQARICQLERGIIYRKHGVHTEYRASVAHYLNYLHVLDGNNNVRVLADMLEKCRL